MNKLNFVSCTCWIKRGIAKEVPDKIELTQEELKRVIDESKQNIDEHVDENEDEDGDDEEMNVSDNEDEEADVTRRYNLDNYDDEIDNDNVAQNLANLAQFSSSQDDPYLEHDSDDSDEMNDFKIKPTDNLLLVGHIEKDASLLEVHVFNEEDDDSYVHHDFLLPAYPLSFEWLNYDSNSPENVNFIAIGDMTSDITIWDLDVVNSLEPVTKLVGHSDAVISLSWNSILRKSIASGSADKTVCVWDLETCSIAQQFKDFKANVQSIQFHPYEAQTLLASDCKGKVSIIDCQSGAMKSWKTEKCEIEKVIWNVFNPYTFFASSSTGSVYCFDCRNDEKYLYMIKAHSDAVTGLTLSSSCPGCLITGSSDKTVKIWDVDEKQAQFVTELPDVNVGSILTLSANPDLPFTFAIGGDNKASNLKIVDISTSKQVRSHFQHRLDNSVSKKTTMTSLAESTSQS